MKLARTSETLVPSYNTTQCYNLEEPNLSSYRHENRKSFISVELYRKLTVFNSNIKHSSLFLFKY
jgi:hypothetical protein